MSRYWYEVEVPVIAKHRVVQEGDWVAWDESKPIQPISHGSVGTDHVGGCFEVSGFDLGDVEKPVSFYACNVKAKGWDNE